MIARLIQSSTATAQTATAARLGNVEDSSANPAGLMGEYVVILDAIGLMEGKRIRHLVARMEADTTWIACKNTAQYFSRGGSLFGPCD